MFFSILYHSASRQQMKMVGVGGKWRERGGVVMNGVTEKGYGKKVGVVYGVVEKKGTMGLL